MIKNYEDLKSKKMGQILCVKKVPFRKSGHIYLLKQPSSLSPCKCTGKTLTLTDVPVHGEHTKPNPIFVACFSLELIMIN